MNLLKATSSLGEDSCHHHLNPLLFHLLACFQLAGRNQITTATISGWEMLARNQLSQICLKSTFFIHDLFNAEVGTLLRHLAADCSLSHL